MLTIVLAIFIFNLVITPTNLFGITLTLIGGAYYAKVELDRKKDSQATLLVDDMKKDEGHEKLLGHGLGQPTANAQHFLYSPLVKIVSDGRS